MKIMKYEILSWLLFHKSSGHLPTHLRYLRGKLAEKREIFITQTLKMMMTFHDSFYKKNPYFF